MSPADRDSRPETQWDLHRPKGHPHKREARSKGANGVLERHGELKV